MVAPGVRPVLAPNPGPMTGAGTNSYVVEDDSGRQAVVVDPGPDLPQHVEALAAMLGPRRPVAVLVTHGHADHLGAAAALSARVGAPVLGHPSLPGVDRGLEDGAVVAVGTRRIEALATPGHADDHLCFWMPGERLLFTGDLVAGSGTVVLAESPGALGQYLASLRRLRALGPSTILPGHGPVVGDGGAKIDEYLAHRAAREAQILEALLRGGAADIASLVGRLYADTPPGLHPMAARNVRAHLDLLAERGIAAEADGRWRLL